MDFFQGLTIALGIYSFIVSGFAFVVWSKIEKAANDAEQAKKDASEKSEIVKDDLSDFKLYVAREHPRREELTSIENKMDVGFKSIFDKVDKVGSDVSNMGNTFRDMLNDKEDRKK